ncbi:MAG: hypothetical protein DPW09_05105 [Anaerolineae bacterium]|nr:hypothetical protein [Anaerolineales bacterium]MCQ3972811.1 hypothetical protein [Anaerolineae bacterium]
MNMHFKPGTPFLSVGEHTMSERIFRIFVSLLSLLVLLPLEHTEAMTLDITTMASSNSTSAVPLSSDFSHRYIVFLDGIRSKSVTPEGNGNFNAIQDKLTELGINDDRFVYFSYSAASDRVGGVYCLGWGSRACSTKKIGDLTSLSLAPIYLVEDTQLSIDRQTRVLTWLIDQILKQDSYAEIDLVGFSLGGIIASRWASQFNNTSLHGKHIHSIVLIESPVGGIPLAGPITDGCSLLDFVCKGWSAGLREYFGNIVLRELRLPPASTSIVDSLRQAPRNFPITSIQSTADYLVNRLNFPLCRNLACTTSDNALVGNGSQLWPSHTLYDSEQLSKRGLATTPLRPVAAFNLISENHNLPLKHEQTAKWVIEAIQATTNNTLNPPTLLTPINGSAISLRPAFDWMDVSTAESYHIEISQNANFSPVEIQGEPTQSSFALTKDLQAGKTYYWRVFARRGSKTSASSTIWSFSTSSPLNPPSLISPTNGGKVTSLRPVLDWADVPNATGYRLDISQNANFANIEIGSELAQSSFTLDRDLQAGKTYYWRVFTRQGNQISGPSTSWSFSISPSNCEPTNRPGVYLYSDIKFGGICYYTATDINDLGTTPIGDNNVSSARVVGLYTVKLYEDPNQKGRSKEINADDDNLDTESIGGKYSSLRIRPQEGSNIVSGISVASGKKYELGKCGKNDTYYLDRKYKFTKFSEQSYDGLWCIKTANDDANNSVQEFLTFELNRPATIYIYFDRRMTKSPAWTGNLFNQNSKRVYTSDGPMDYFVVYSCKSHPGVITLGGLKYQGGNNASSMYVVAFREEQGGEQLCTGAQQSSALTNAPILPSTATPIPIAVPLDTPTPTSTPVPTMTPTSTETPTSLPLPDLVAQSMMVELETNGDCNNTTTQLGVRVEVANIGQANAGPFTVQANGIQQLVDGLAAGQTTSVWLAGASSGGETTATIDVLSQVLESNETNNQITQFVSIPTLPPTCTPPVEAPTEISTPTSTATDIPLPDDCGAQCATATPSLPDNNIPVASGKITGQIVLEGRTDHSGATILVSLEPCLDATQTRLPGDTVAITDAGGYFEFDSLADQPYQCLQVVSERYLIGQYTLPQGNLGKLTLPGGDVTGDGQINVLDLSFIAAHYKDGDLSADINGGGLVNIFDLSIAANNYGKHGPIMDWK